MSKIPAIQLLRGIPAAGGVSRTSVLAGEIPGVETFHVVASPGATWRSHNAHDPDRLCALFFMEGEGEIASPTFVGRFRNPALFVPPPNSPFHVKATSRGWSALEILLPLDEAYLEGIAAGEGFTYFVSYADCSTYREAIKSEKTVSRTLVKENLLPRFCMGSVETTGPDLVAAHRHPMLEQLFFGLPGNNCFVRADEDELLFGENVLLHIPLGSNHSVRVAPGDKLHYLWLDFFRSQEGMRWITEMHKTEE